MPQLDLSDEVNIEAPRSLSHNQLLVERVICKTFNHCKRDAVITDRLRSLFTDKLLRIGRTMHKLGGWGRAYQIEKWKEKTSHLQMKLYPGQRNGKQKANIKLQKAQEKYKQLVTSLGPKVTKHNKSWSQYSAQYKSQQNKLTYYHLKITGAVCKFLLLFNVL